MSLYLLAEAGELLMAGSTAGAFGSDAAGAFGDSESSPPWMPELPWDTLQRNSPPPFSDAWTLTALSEAGALPSQADYAAMTPAQQMAAQDAMTPAERQAFAQAQEHAYFGGPGTPLQGGGGGTPYFATAPAAPASPIPPTVMHLAIPHAPPATSTPSTPGPGAQPPAMTMTAMTAPPPSFMNPVPPRPPMPTFDTSGGGGGGGAAPTPTPWLAIGAAGAVLALIYAGRKKKRGR